MVPHANYNSTREEDYFTKFLKQPFFDGLDIPRLEVSFIASRYHREKPLLLDWQFYKWSNKNKTCSLQLTFDRPEHVSMQLPQDRIEIKFNDASVFRSSQGDLVEYGLTLDRIIRPQVSLGIFTEAVEESGDTVVQTLPWLGGSSVALGVFMSFGLVYLWGFINNL